MRSTSSWRASEVRNTYLGSSPCVARLHCPGHGRLTRKNTIRRMLHQVVDVRIERGTNKQSLAVPFSNGEGVTRPVMGTVYGVPGKFWQPSRKFLNALLTGFFYFVYFYFHFVFSFSKNIQEFKYLFKIYKMPIFSFFYIFQILFLFSNFIHNFKNCMHFWKIFGKFQKMFMSFNFVQNFVYCSCFYFFSKSVHSKCSCFWKLYRIFEKCCCFQILFTVRK